MPLARREQPALHPRCHVPGGSVPYPSQSRRLRQATLLRLQHPASQSDFNVQSGSLRRRSRRCQRTPQVDLQLRALNSRAIAPLNASVLYVNSSAGDNHIYRTFFRWRQDKRRLIFVVDDCPIELHRELADCARYPDSELSLLTLDFDTARSNDQDRRIQLGPFDDEPISDIVKQAYPGLGPSEASRVVSFANGFPGMAVLLGDAFLESVVNPASLQDDVLLNRLIWGRQPESEEGRNVLSACSLFAALGIDGARVNERAFVASSVCGISEDRLYHWVNLFKSRGLVQQHGDFVLVLPKPVALRLADERWRGIPKETAERWFSEDAPGNMPERLFNALCEQLSYLDFAPDAKELVDRLCSSRGPFGQPAALRTERGSRALRALVETNPDATMDALERAFDGESEAGLQAIDGEARRNLVGAIEKLIFRRGVFRRAARLLLAFSAAETESYSNNATGLFKDLFHLFLSGTQAIGDEKLALADEILASNDKHRRAIVVYGLADGLRTDHFTRMGGAEAQGSGRPLQDWQPTPLEARDYLHGIVTRLTKIGCGSDGLAAQARRGIAHNLRGLIGAGPLLFKVVAEAIEKIIESHGPYWPEALDSLTLSLRYEGPGFPDEFRHEVERLRNLLLPTDLTDRLRFFVSDLPWGFMGSDMDGAEKCARRLADELAQQPQVLFNALPELSLRGAKANDGVWAAPWCRIR